MKRIKTEVGVEMADKFQGRVKSRGCGGESEGRRGTRATFPQEGQLQLVPYLPRYCQLESAWVGEYNTGKVAPEPPLAEHQETGARSVKVSD